MSAQVGPASIDELPQILPIFPLAGALLLPRGRLPLNIFEPRYLAMVRDALAAERMIGMVQPTGADSRANVPPVYTVGCLGKITAFSETDDGRFLITLTGVCRFRIGQELARVTPYRKVLANYDEFAADLAPGTPPNDAVNRERLGPALKGYLEMHGLAADWHAIEQAPAETLINALAMICPFAPPEKQALLEAGDVMARADMMVTLLEMALAGRHSDPQPPMQ